MSDSFDSRRRGSEYVPISKYRILSATLLTFAFCGSPLMIFLKKSFFRKFCDFHTTKFNLGKKAPYQIALLSLGLSMLYTSMIFPIYYYFMLKILGVSGVLEMSDQIKLSSKSTSMKYPVMKKLDLKIVTELDRYFKVEDKAAKEFLSETLGKDYMFVEKTKKQVKKDENV